MGTSIVAVMDLGTPCKSDLVSGNRNVHSLHIMRFKQCEHLNVSPVIEVVKGCTQGVNVSVERNGRVEGSYIYIDIYRYVFLLWKCYTMW